MNKVDLEKTNLTVPDLATLAKNGTVILTRAGKPMAVVKDLSGSDWESISLANNPRFQDLIEESRRSFREQGGIGLDEIRKAFGLKRRRTSARKKS